MKNGNVEIHKTGNKKHSCMNQEVEHVWILKLYAFAHIGAKSVINHRVQIPIETF